MTRRTFVAGAGAAAAMAQSAPKSKMGVATTSFAVRRFASTLEFLEHVHSLGGGGIQSSLSSTEPEFLAKLRARAEALGMFIEVMAPLPRGDTANFERIVAGAREVGALCLRVACLSGRRYETFDSMDAWKKFVADSRAGIERAIPILARHRVRMAIENHKDWTIDEMVPLLKGYSSEFLGACLDTGNNIALLDDPMETAEALAPFAFSTHIKDMGVQSYADGFLLSEVPLGEGIIDLKRVVEIVRKHHPGTRHSLEMMTRNPLQIPCLTEKFWVTMPERSGARLARMLRLVRDKPSPQPLPVVDALTREARARLEEDNVRHCLRYSWAQMGV
jgi:sugar phosphate isomerase/epimerase